MKVELLLIGRDTAPATQYTLSLEDQEDKDYLYGSIDPLKRADRGSNLRRFVVAKSDLKRALLILLGRIEDGKNDTGTVLRLVLDG